MPVTTLPISNVGSPPDDPTLLLPGTLFIPDGDLFPGPRPCVVGTVAANFSGDGDALARIAPIMLDLAAQGYLCLSHFVRLLNPILGQTTSGQTPQQQNDLGIGVALMHSATPMGFPASGFVSTFGGSGSAHHAMWRALTGTDAGTKADAAICLSPVTDMGDRQADVTTQFIVDCQNFTGLTDPAAMTALSPIALPLNLANPILHYNGNNEAMPLSQQTLFAAAMPDAIGTGYTAVTNTGALGRQHSFTMWPGVREQAIAWLNARVAEFVGEPPPPPPPPPPPAPGTTEIPYPRLSVLEAMLPMNPSPTIAVARTIAPVPIPTSSVPIGVFSATSGGGSQPIEDITLASPDINGIVIGSKWWQIEPSEGVYDFGFLDTQIARITAVGKTAILQISTGNMGHSDRGSKPDWVMDAVGSNTITFLDNGPGGLGETTIPLQWYQGYLDKKKAMYRALGAHFAGNNTIVGLACNFCNSVTEDWGPVDGTEVDGILPTGSTPVTRQLAAGYTHARMMEAARQTLNTVADAFPQAILYVPLGTVRSAALEPGGGSDLAQSALDEFRALYGTDRLLVGHNGFSAKSGAGAFQHDNPPIAGQALFFVYGDTSYRMNKGEPGEPEDILVAFFDKAFTSGLSFIEVYERDVINSPLGGAIHYGYELFNP